MAEQRDAPRRPRARRARVGTGTYRREGAHPRGHRAPLDLVGRVLTALEYLAERGGVASAHQMASDTGIARASAYRLCARLEAEGILNPQPGPQGYAGGARLMSLAMKVLNGSVVHGARHRILQSLVEALGETCNLTMLAGDEVVYVDRVETAWPLRMYLSPGSRVPIHCTASGKLLLSLLPAARRKELLHAGTLRPCTPATTTDPQRLEAMLRRIRKERVGVDEEEFVAGMIAVAVPVTDGAGRTLAALALHAPKARLTLEQARAQVPALRAAARRLGHTLTGEDDGHG